MGAYRVARLKTEVDDQAHNFGFTEDEFELRMARVPLECSDCGISYARIGPGFRVTAGHAHRRQEEVYVLVNGSVRVKVGDDVVQLDEPWTAIRIAPETVRAVEGGPEGAELLFVGAPNTGPGDGINTENWWVD